MKRSTYNSVTRYALILCLSVVLLFSQIFRLHMHIQHDDVTASADHIVTVHAASSLQDSRYDIDRQDDVPNHHPAELKVSPDRVVMKVALLKAFILLIFIASIFLNVLPLRYFHRLYFLKNKLTSLSYLFRPPLRAPPLS